MSHILLRDHVHMSKQTFPQHNSCRVFSPQRSCASTASRRRFKISFAKYGIYLINFTTHCCLDCRIFFSNAKSAGLALNKVMRWFIFTAALPSSPLSATTTTIITSDTHMHRNMANRAPHHHQCPTQPQGKMTPIAYK